MTATRPYPTRSTAPTSLWPTSSLTIIVRVASFKRPLSNLFMIGEDLGADVTVRNGWGQTPADVASLCRLPLLHLVISRCRAPSLHQYLQDKLEKSRGEVEEAFTIRAMWKSLAESSPLLVSRCTSFGRLWHAGRFWNAGFRFVVGWPQDW